MEWHEKPVCIGYILISFKKDEWLKYLKSQRCYIYFGMTGVPVTSYYLDVFSDVKFSLPKEILPQELSFLYPFELFRLLLADSLVLPI